MTAVSIVRGFLDHVFSGELDRALALVHEEARFVPARPTPDPRNPLSGTYSGIEGARQFFANFAALLEPGDFNVEAAFGDEDHAALYGSLRHKSRATGKDFASDWALISRIRDGKISFYHFYEDTDALQAAIS